ncbi:ASKHA domain-containing protein [Methanoregula sp.]|uniref:ASKHA domain-containing protein n=1 Tax=Methanoregula sp. TaxID=2052170 RepID=UPI00262A4310|nr:ASKHA domain-containing protein [Methanoregula sp.]MDD5141937.1 ASKHA domain-containing protein [Methanoregula sp.]
MRTVTFLPSYYKIDVPRGTTVLDATQRAGLSMNVVCGGQGKCGKCIVFIRSGRAEFDRQKYGRFFTEPELQKGGCLACETIVQGDLHVFVPESTLIQEQKILVEGLDHEIEFHPSVRKYYVELHPPSLADPSPDLSRFLWGIQKSGGPVAEKMYAPLAVLREMPSILRHSEWKVTATIGLVPGGYRVIDLQENDTSKRVYGAAVDLGSTTIVVYLWDLVTGKVVGVASNYNKQISCGEDILARVNFARKNGLTKLQALAAESINQAITSASNSAGIDREDIYDVVVAGNTVMTHMLLGIDPAYMIAEPYVPVVRRALSIAASRLGIACNPNGGVYAFPAVSDFIGGDIIADILACGMGEREEISLLVDIGTNFEVVLGNKEWMFSCAGAAGPALEGGEVLFGMRANPGAIEKITIDPVTLDPKYSTINGIKPRGICGSGLIDLLAELLLVCVIDRTGRINTGIEHPRIRKGTHFPEFVVAWAKETDTGKDIVITENDIKNLIMSKASVHAACVTLMKEAGVTHKDISTIYFAGAFGNYLDKKNATIIGLIPEIDLKDIKNIGNGAVTGANIALINRRARKTLDDIAYRIAYIELNAESSFMDEYTGSTFLPHTDFSLFPGVQELLDSCRIRKE